MGAASIDGAAQASTTTWNRPASYGEAPPKKVRLHWSRTFRFPCR